jgi:hypothetical protein
MSEYHAYTFFVNRLDLLRRAINSFPALLGDLTIIDNSEHENELKAEGPVELFRPPVPLTYAQSMNLMLKDALEKKVDFIIHFHSDAYSTNPNAVDELLEKVRGYKAENRRWACAWTHYDLLWAINPVALEDIGGWDTNLPNYFGDNMARRMWELAGWECIDTHIQGIDHEGSATINSDPKLKFLNAQTFPMSGYYYQLAWGGEPGHERYEVKFNRPDLFGKGEK